MNYKLVAIDMDGTLLNSNNEISKRTCDAIEAATKQGVHIVLATGRILKSAEHYAMDIDLNSYILACNGAIIMNKSKDIIYSQPMNLDIAKKVMELGQELGIYYHFYDRSKFYSNIYIKEIANYYNTSTLKLKGQSIDIDIFEDYNELLNRENFEVYKFLFIDDVKEKLEKLRQELSGFKEINVSSSWDNNLEIMDNRVSKGMGLDFLSKKLNIDPKEIIAIGDNENDLSMIQFAGLGVAMENGDEAIKNQADIVTRTNDEDGVARIIEKYILGIGDLV